MRRRQQMHKCTNAISENWEFYKISPDDANQSIRRVHAKKKKMPQRTVIPLHYQVDDLDDLTGV